ncbi:MAG: hypothetical protein A3K05_02995 [Candidatus Doudnabacteria bacterium RIFCSPHIGHO2_01_48_18]|uniref:Uncharacterized protein n=1 Tax=Candidatus Doudnabacteria bacterium RIFCSPLOWO2_02_FULL_48_13 TaxID=1817845 RepID=A0A1F5QD26_9BACT|nr:MAG: hypothetical protein A3K05_02995 [Candidatus Doudnabacteria bacterium RIFCSPHIGHO2_01_48_18]OGE91903.1 MAG: hypothetical protein A3F44_03820 [Candidatus Doudnabacteria bacterium RIFCSPHIGHO2_12_FULL_47_25]OGF00114.1 MAG: hypothetical protein A3J05_00060 [Candidatus Doudnabacteria bacterium RIFCSPLOWO2_02_FULL_48_13]
MEEKIKQLFNLNARLSQEVQSSLPVIVKSLEKTKFKYTNKALLSFVPKSGYLNSAILEASASRNVYAVAILSRSMIEHNFRHLYIYVRALNDDSDDVGKRYYKTLKGNEDLESFTKINNYNKAVYPEKTNWNTKGEHNNAIREVGKEFRIEQIFYYLIANNNNEKNKVVERFKKEYLLQRLINYTNLSSGVHGGPFGELALLNLQKDKKKFDDTLYKFASDSFELHYSTVEATYLFAYLMDNKMQVHYEKIKGVKENK